MPLRAACICPRETFHTFLHKLCAAVKLLILNVHIVRLPPWLPDSSTFTMGLFEWTEALMAQIELAPSLKLCDGLWMSLFHVIVFKWASLKVVCVIKAIPVPAYSMSQCADFDVFSSSMCVNLCLQPGVSEGHRRPSVLRATQATASPKPNHQCPSQLGLPCTVFTNTKLQQDDLEQLSVCLTLSPQHTHTHAQPVRGFALATGTDCVAYPERKLQHNTQLDPSSHAWLHR